MTRYEVKLVGEKLGQKLWGVWDTKRSDWVRDHNGIVEARTSEAAAQSLQEYLERNPPDAWEKEMVYRLTTEDVNSVAEEMGETLTDAERVHVQKGIEAGMGSSWHDIIEAAIDDVVASRQD